MVLVNSKKIRISIALSKLFLHYFVLKIYFIWWRYPMVFLRPLPPFNSHPHIFSNERCWGGHMSCLTNYGQILSKFCEWCNAEQCVRNVMVSILLRRNCQNWAKKLNFWLLLRGLLFTPSYALWITRQCFAKLTFL